MRASLAHAGGTRQIAQSLEQAHWLPAETVDELVVDDEQTTAPLADVLSERIPFRSAQAFWGDFNQLSIVRDVVIALRNDGLPCKSELPGLARIEFEVAAFRDTFTPREYTAPGFGDRMGRLGWACAFKGAGHDRLVSRRWLEYGPWRLIRDEANDLSFVQFHDLEADPQTALEQARPGHQRMGISNTGGFLQKRYVFESELRGFYLADEQVHEIVVTGREVTPVEMLDACALRHYQGFGAEQPLRNVRYIFIEGEEAARAHLHELWLRELECWAIIDGEKTRLDDTYQPPPPQKPQWVQDVEAREGG